MNLKASRTNQNVISLEQQLNLILKRNTAKDFLMALKEENQCLVKVERKEMPFVKSNVLVKRHCESRSAEHGFIHYDINYDDTHNSGSGIIIEQYLPWHMTAYTFKLPKDIQIQLEQSINRKRGTVLRMHIHSGKVVSRRISLEYDLLLLKYTEYPIDPHRGLDIVPAKITHYSKDNERVAFWTMPSLVRMPVPDFSMPYNVITITCTLLALFHGQLFNRLTRSYLILQDSHKDKLLKRLLKNVYVKLKALL